MEKKCKNMDFFTMGICCFGKKCVSLSPKSQSDMKKLTTIAVMLLVPLALLAGKSYDMEEICRRVDAETAHWQEYVARRQARIDSLRTLLYSTNIATETYRYCNGLVDEYCSFQNDSALFYCKMLGEIAPWTEDRSMVELAKMKMARQAVKSGMYEAAMNYLAEVDTTGTGRDEQAEYWRVRHFAYVEMAAYCYIWDKRNEYKEEERRCREQLFRLLPEGSGEWLMLKAYDALMTDRFEEAEALSDQCMKHMERYGMMYREAAFHRRFICEGMNKNDEARYWLAECAITEIRQGMTDQIGLWSLASKMGEDLLGKSYEYIRFSWDAISQFGVNTRSWQIAPVLSNIEHQYQAEKERTSRMIVGGITMLTILSLLLILLLIEANRQRKRLAAANLQLSTLNTQLSMLNTQLSDASRAKEEYIVQLLAYNSDFINQKEEERRKASKLLRNEKTKELTRLLNAADKTGKELDQLLARFDEIFLGLYPTFVDDFNALLQEENRIKVGKAGQMNTPLRIFALLRLGIDKVPDVARILHCSPQTIYNYRNNLRNAYSGNREEFEEAVRSIGMPVLVNNSKTISETNH